MKEEDVSDEGTLSRERNNDSDKEKTTNATGMETPSGWKAGVGGWVEGGGGGGNWGSVGG